MPLDFSRFFSQYEALVAETDALFERVRGAHPEQVRCGAGCSDCCFALFDLSLIEALYLNHHFNRLYQGDARAQILERADTADREVYRFKRAVYKASEEGVPASEILDLAAKTRIRCALLNEDQRCDLYQRRPITCRLYGIPTASGEEAHTCPTSGFIPGEPYPTVKVDKIQDRLLVLSQELSDFLKTTHQGLAEILVPVSMALLATYDKEYLGTSGDACGECDGGASWVLGEDQPDLQPLAPLGVKGNGVGQGGAQQ